MCSACGGADWAPRLTRMLINLGPTFGIGADVRPNWRANQQNQKEPIRGSVIYAFCALHKFIGRASSMGVLMLRCPMTDRSFSTGIVSDKDRFSRMLDTSRVVRCPQCGEDHRWRPEDAWLVELRGGRLVIVSDSPRAPRSSFHPRMSALSSGR
jgi:hypothetical protein